MTGKKAVWIVFGLLGGALLSLIATARPERRDVIPSEYQPVPELSPDEVVGRQLQAMKIAAQEEQAFAWCYQFAAPSNRDAVGSVERFTAMLGMETYAPLIGHTEHLMGRPTIANDEATVMVTIIDRNAQPAIYRFILRRQTAPPYEDCWMTIAVYRMGNPAMPPAHQSRWHGRRPVAQAGVLARY